MTVPRLAALAVLSVACATPAPTPAPAPAPPAAVEPAPSLPVDAPAIPDATAPAVAAPPTATAPSAAPTPSAAPPTPTRTPPAATPTSKPTPAPVPATSPAPVPAPAPATAAPASTTAAPSPTAPIDHPAIRYTLDAPSSWLYTIVRYDRTATMAGHDHAVRATTFTGSVTWDVDDVSTCAVHIEFPVTALHVDTPGLRAKAGLEGDSDPKDYPKIEDNFRSASQLDAAHFATLHFTSTACEATASGAKVTGLLGMHGVEKSVTMNMTIDATDSAFHAKGSLKFKHETFGFSPFTAALGMLRNDDTLELRVDVKGAPKS